MIRRQITLAPEQDRKLRDLAERQGMTESAVMRRALDQFEPSEAEVVARLRAAGLLVETFADDDDDLIDDLEEIGRQLEALQAE